MRSKRPSLAESMQKVARPELVSDLGADNREPGFHAATRTGKKKITAVVDPAVHAQLRHLAIEVGRSGDRVSVTLRLDRDLWERFTELQEVGAIEDRTAVINRWFREKLAELESKER